MDARNPLIRAIWLKAQAEGSVSVYYGTMREAEAMRLKLYRGVTPVRKEPATDPALYSAWNDCEITTSAAPNGAAVMTIQHKTRNSLMSQAAAQLGIPIDGSDEAALSEARLLESLSTTPETPPNEFE